MSTIDEVLMSMSNEVTVTDEVLVIDPSTRQINVPGSELVFGVEADAGSERKQFQCPRYVGNNVDLAASFLRVNFRNANGETDSYLVEDVRVVGDDVVFSWVLSPKAVRYKGQTKFVVCVVGADLKLAWHTTLATGIVLEGLEPSNAHVTNETSDVVAQLIAMVEVQTAAVEAEGGKQIKAVQAAAEAAEAASVARIEAKGASALATIPEDYTAVQNAVRGAANAIRGKASGEVIRVDDVSPMEHYPVAKVKGKNLFNIGALEVMPTNYGVRISNVDSENNAFTITTADSHTGNGYCGLTNGAGNYVPRLRDVCPQMEAGRKYVLSGISETATKTLYLRSPNRSWVFGTSLTITEEHLDAKLAFYGLNSASGEGTGDCVISNLQIEEGDTATEYTPYIDPTTVTVTRCGKNLLPYPFVTTGGTIAGVTITSENGAIILNGTATKNTSVTLFIGNIRVKGKYTISGITGGSGATYYIQPYIDDTTVGGTTDSSRTYDWDGVLTRLNLNMVSGYTFDNLRVLPVLEYGSEATGYEPYTGETQIPAADGTVSGLAAVSPTMTLLTDTAGVNIECEYSRDTNKVINEILEKITALGG